MHGATIKISNIYCVRNLTCKSNGTGTVHPNTGHEDPEGEVRYSATLSLTSALDGVGGQRHAPAALPTEKDSESSV